MNTMNRRTEANITDNTKHRILCTLLLLSILIILIPSSSCSSSFGVKQGIRLLDPNTQHLHPSLIPRGGGEETDDESDYEDESDEYTDDDEIEKNHNIRPQQPRREHPSKSSSSSTVWNLMKKTMDLASKVTVTSLKTSIDLASPKHVSLRDILGVWRFDQQIGDICCAANLHLYPNSTVSLQYNSKTQFFPYTFRERSYPRYCTISLYVPAFQYPDDDRPVFMLYKGKFRRKVLDPDVIYLKGALYRVEKTLLGGKREVYVGTFRGRKRVQLVDLREEQEEEEEEDTEYDDYDDEDYSSVEDEEEEY